MIFSIYFWIDNVTKVSKIIIPSDIESYNKFNFTQNNPDSSYFSQTVEPYSNPIDLANVIPTGGDE